MTVIVRGTVRTYLASLEDLTLKVMGVSSVVASSAMVRMMCGGEEDRDQEDDLGYRAELSDENGIKPGQMLFFLRLLGWCGL